MEQDRNLRNLIPPLVFVASLVWVSLLQSGWGAFQSDNVGATVAALVAGGAAVVVALGFVLSSASIWLLRTWSYLYFRKTIDIAGFSDEMIGSFGRKVGLSKDLALRYPLPCAALYDHWVVREKYKGVHEWAARRWNVFHVSVHCCLALVLAHGAWLTYYVARGSVWTPSCAASARCCRRTRPWSRLLKSAAAQRQAVRPTSSPSPRWCAASWRISSGVGSTRGPGRGRERRRRWEEARERTDLRG